MSRYGKAPTVIGTFDLDFEEYMHYMYLPVQINDKSGYYSGYQWSIPDNLRFAEEIINAAFDHEEDLGNEWTYIYVTARRGYATPGNPLNRPGWHSDGFGTPDVNYVWTDRYPTEFAVGTFENVSEDHIESVRDFESAIENAKRQRPSDREIFVGTYNDNVLLRLDERVIHRAPEIPAPGGERSFFKVSFSNEKYNLKGNSHNYGLEYEWTMFDRVSTRNDPARAGKDSA